MSIKHYYDNGQLKLEHKFNENRSVVNLKKWYENGQLKVEMNYKYGINNGIQKVLYENGQLKYEYNYVNGVKHGIIKEWRIDGTLAYTRYFIFDDEFSKLEYYNIIETTKKEITILNFDEVFLYNIVFNYIF